MQDNFAVVGLHPLNGSSTPYLVTTPKGPPKFPTCPPEPWKPLAQVLISYPRERFLWVLRTLYEWRYWHNCSLWQTRNWGPKRLHTSQGHRTRMPVGMEVARSHPEPAGPVTTPFVACVFISSPLLTDRSRLRPHETGLPFTWESCFLTTSFCLSKRVAPAACAGWPLAGWSELGPPFTRDPSSSCFSSAVADPLHPPLPDDNCARPKRHDLLPSLCFSNYPIWASLIFSSPLFTSRSSSVGSIRPLGTAMITCSQSQSPRQQRLAWPRGVFQRRWAPLPLSSCSASSVGTSAGPSRMQRATLGANPSLGWAWAHSRWLPVWRGCGPCSRDGPKLSCGRQGLIFLRGTWCQESQLKSWASLKIFWLLRQGFPPTPRISSEDSIQLPGMFWRHTGIQTGLCTWLYFAYACNSYPKGVLKSTLWFCSLMAIFPHFPLLPSLCSSILLIRNREEDIKRQERR